MPDPYIVVLAGLGALVLLTAWLPMVLREAPLSLPIVCVGVGALLWFIPGVPGVLRHTGLGHGLYVAYALEEATFEAPEAIWSIVAFVVLVSILLHGASVTPMMRYLDRRSGRVTEQLTLPMDDSTLDARKS